MRFVFFALLDGTFLLVQVVIFRKPLDFLADEIPIRHRVTDGGNLEAHLTQDEGHTPGGLAFSSPGTHSANGNEGFGRFDLRVPGA